MLAIDTHAHLTDEHYDNPQEMINNFVAVGLQMVFTVGCDKKSSLDAVEFAKKYDNVYAIIGFHPDDAEQYDESIFDNLSNPKVIGVGEIGLDYHTTKDDKELQKQVFVSQLEIAHKYGLPITIHSRDAVGDTLEILKSHKNLLTNGGIWHCFNESQETFNEIKKLGLIVGFGGVTTFKNAKNTTQLLKNAELTDFVLETDCPYLTPEPMRGKAINQPKYVLLTAQHIADVKEVNINVIIEATNNNTFKLFKKLGK